MRSAQVLAVRVLLLGSLLASAGCFRPKYLPGGYSCSDGGAHVCPDNQICDPSTNLCVGSIGGAGGSGKGGAGGKSGTGGRDAGVDMPVDRPCTGAIANCQPSDAGMCDPVCNTGCDCFDKCSVNAAGTRTCNAPTPGAVGIFGQCSQTNTGLTQTDNCAPGEFCLTNGECGSRCYKFCRTSSDCPNGASCSRDAGGGNLFCDAPPVNCNPVKNAASSLTYSGCVAPPNTLGCYLSSNSGRTICDCEFAAGRFGDSCTHSRDCLAGLVCYDPTGGTRSGGPTCYPVCRLPLDGGVDPTNPDAGETGCNGGPGNCLPFLSGGSVYGFCNDG